MKSLSLPGNTFSRASLSILFATCLIVGACKDDESPATGVNITSISPESPATLEFYQTGPNDRVLIQYDYIVSEPEGGRIWIQPYTDGSISDGYLYSSSTVLKGSGSRQVLVSIDAGNGTVHIDEFRISVKDPDQTKTILEKFIPVDYTFEE